jgi:N-acetyl-alpha-D-glucosaminyl L-malate synthase BshA
MKTKDTKLNIGIVLYPTFGGSGVLATELGKKLAEKGHSVHFIASAPPARLDGFYPNIYFHEVNIPAYPLFEFAPYEVALTSTMVHVALNNHLDIIHAHYAIPHASAAVMAREILKSKGKRVPVVTTLHGTDITLVGRDRSYEPVISYAINQSDAVTAVSDYLRIETLRHFNIERPINVIYNFIDKASCNEKNNSGIRQFAAPNQERIITHISNFRPVKRILDVVDVFAGLHMHIPSRLLMVGDGPLRQQAEERVDALGLKEAVIFIGKSTNTSAILSSSDLFLLPSESESFGLSALEAMACGVPVIATRTGGMPEVQIHNSTGFLSPVGDVKDMTSNAIKILKDQSLHRRFSTAAKERAKQFEADVIIPQYEALYDQLMN